MKYSQHPLSSAFPAMPDADFRALVEDIRQHGQRDPATLADGMIVDGWHRYRACEELGIPCRFDAFTGSDAVSFVRSKNQHRRHYQKSQQAAIEVALTAWAAAHRPKKGEAASPFSTNKEMAERAGVTERTIIHAKRAHEAGLGDAVRDGKVSAEKAGKLAKAAPDKAAQVARGEKALDQAVQEIERPAPQKPVEKPEAPAIDLQAKHDDLKERYDDLLLSAKELADQVQTLDAIKIGDTEVAKEMNRLRAQVRSLEEVRDRLMTTNAEQVRQIKGQQKTIAKLEAQIAEQKAVAEAEF